MGIVPHIAKSAADIAKIEAQLYPLIGNGSPGHVSKLEGLVAKLMQWKWWVLGCSAGASAVISVVAWWVR